MEPPAITRHRRPFLAPVWLTLLAVLVVVGIAFSAYRAATTTDIVLVPSGDKEPGTIDDPPISSEGEQRAQRLAQMFGGGGPGRFDAVYVSSERRAQQEAAPLLEQLHLAPVVYAGKDASAIAAGLLRAHDGGAVLVIGGPAALQQFLRELAGAEGPPPDDPDVLYIVSVPSVGRAHVLRARY